MWRVSADDNDSWNVEIEETGQKLELRATGDTTTLTSSLVGHWTMNDNAADTNVVDSSVNGNNGTAQQNTNVLSTTGKINGALTFNGTSDYIDVGTVIGTGAYTKVAWVKRADGDFFNNIVSSSTMASTASHALFAPYYWQFKLSAGHVEPYNAVQDSTGLEADRWYHVAVTYDPDVDSGKMVLYKDGVEIDSATSVPANSAIASTYIGKYNGVGYINGSLDNVMVFDKTLTTEEIEALYNEGNGTETIPVERFGAEFRSNSWSFDNTSDFQTKIDFHYSELSNPNGSIGITVGNGDSYVSISAGSENNNKYFYYKTNIGGSEVVEKEARATDDGTLYISYDSNSNELYLSHAGYGSGNAYAWLSISNPLQSQWSSPVQVIIGGGSERVILNAGNAYLDNFEINQAAMLGWEPVNDINGDGFINWFDIQIIIGNWLGTGQGDVNNDGIVNLRDIAEVALAW